MPQHPLRGLLKYRLRGAPQTPGVRTASCGDMAGFLSAVPPYLWSLTTLFSGVPAKTGSSGPSLPALLISEVGLEEPQSRFQL